MARMVTAREKEMQAEKRKRTRKPLSPKTEAGKKALATTAKRRKVQAGTKASKGAAKSMVTGAVTGLGMGKVLKGLKKAAVKGMLKPRTPGQIARVRAAGANAKKKRKAGKGQQK